MTETVTVPRAEYDRLRAMEEDIEARVAAGEEELVPSEIADRLIDGASPLRVWREYRGLSQSRLVRVSGVNRVQIVEIEGDRNAGSVRTLRKLADALGVAPDDIVTG
ncbi:MAG: helix-turn-helix domain-containing protein [Defluviicoccus sp.]|nr:helix-turn-helix domain-containing protein [Defluviicoccus sp.]MDE0278932.1 helix-turn-helix domain-containing protein [Defluviicoccus sp.]